MSVDKAKVIATYIELMREFDKLPADAKPADGMPELPIWRARSFYFTILAIVLMAGALFGVDVMGKLSSLGLGSNIPAVLENMDLIMAGLSALLAYRERLNPNYKLVWKRMASIAEDPKSAASMIDSMAKLGIKL